MSNGPPNPLDDIVTQITKEAIARLPPSCTIIVIVDDGAPFGLGKIILRTNATPPSGTPPTSYSALLRGIATQLEPRGPMLGKVTP